MKFRISLMFILLAAGCKTAGSTDSAAKDIEVPALTRTRIIRSAEVFQGIENPNTKSELEIKNGPFPKGAVPGKDYFEWGQTITCKFAEKNFVKPPSGLSPKFLCDILDAKGEVVAKAVKIKYDKRNPEIYNEPSASRILWLLGFPADNYYSVQVKCIGCPESKDVWSFIKDFSTADQAKQASMRAEVESLLKAGTVKEFSPAVIEKKWAEALTLEGNEDSGWSFVDDLLLPKERLAFEEPKRSEELAKREALTILAGMLGHVDNQPGNQRLYCKDPVSKTDCDPSQVYFVIQDLGATMGGFRLSWDLRTKPTDHAQLALATGVWASSHSTSVFAKKSTCVVTVASLHPTQTLGPAKMAPVSEAGRKFLISRFVALGGGQGTELTEPVKAQVRTQLTKVFTAGRNGELHEDTQWWVDTLMEKLDIVAKHKGCVS